MYVVIRTNIDNEILFILTIDFTANRKEKLYVLACPMEFDLQNTHLFSSVYYFFGK